MNSGQWDRAFHHLKAAAVEKKRVGLLYFDQLLSSQAFTPPPFPFTPRYFATTKRHEVQTNKQNKQNNNEQTNERKQTNNHDHEGNRSESFSA